MAKTLALTFILLFFAACSPSNSSSNFESLPAGNAERGATLFTETVNGAPACSTCHQLDDTVLVGPGFAGYGEIAGTMVEGQSAEAYTYESITAPARHMVSGFANVMYNSYGNKLTPQDIADLIAFLLQQ